MSIALAKELANFPAPAPLLTIRAGAVFAFMPCSERLVVCGTGPTSVARMVSLTTCQESFRFDKTPPDVRGCAVSEDGGVIAFAAIRDRVALYEAQTARKLQALKAGNDGELSGLAFAPGSHALLHSSWRGLTMMDASASPMTRPLQGSAAYPDNTMYRAIAFAASGDQFVAAWSHGRLGNNISLFGWPSGDETRRLTYDETNGFDRHLNQILFSPGEQSLVLKMHDGAVAIMALTDTGAVELQAEWITHADVAPEIENTNTTYNGCLCFSPDGTLLAYAVGSMLGLWTWSSGVCLGKWSLPGQNPRPYQIGFSPSGREVVVSLHSSRSIYLYRLADLLNTRNIDGN